MDWSLQPSGPGLARVPALRTGAPGLRVHPWHGDRRVAQVGPSRDGRRVTARDLERCLAQFRRDGVVEAFTPALHPFDAAAYLAAGFAVHERLHLLERPGDEPVPDVDRPGRMIAGRPWHRTRILEIDAAAFEPFWRFDRRALREARTATPSARYRVAIDGRRPVGYAVTGLSGSRGYLQRLAVDPATAGRGWGRALLADSLDWLARHRVHGVSVNTQRHNERALELYRRNGFVPQRDGLVVLRWSAR